MLRVLNGIEARIDPEFMEISGAEAVTLRIDGEGRELSSLSTGFSAILKIVQAIVSGFGSLTNATDIERVEGLVFIDEIESHVRSRRIDHPGNAAFVDLLRDVFGVDTNRLKLHRATPESQAEAKGLLLDLVREAADGR